MKIVCTLLALASFAAARAQDLTGTWEGVFSTDTWARKEEYFMRLELVQVDRELHGWLFISNAKTDAKPQVVYLLSGELPRKSGAAFHLYRAGIGDTQYDRTRAEYFNDLRIELKAGDTAVQVLRGYWFPNVSNGSFANGAAGRYAVAKTAGTVAADGLKGWMKTREMIIKNSREPQRH